MNDEKRKQKFNKKKFTIRRPAKKDMERIISELEKKLKNSIKPEAINGLNAFERRLIHRHFDHNKEIQTRTYRDGNKFTLYVYPVGNIEKFAKEKAQEALDSGSEVDLPPMGSYERYIVHASLKDVDGIETESHGEGSERHVHIVSKKFGRGLKKIVKKIKLF